MVVFNDHMLKMIKVRKKAFISITTIFVLVLLTKRKDFFVSQCNITRYTNISSFIDYHVPFTERDVDFQEDVLALVHIQKTSGSFLEEAILSNLSLFVDNKWKPICVKSVLLKQRRFCHINNHLKRFFWDRYIARYCDIHAGYTELDNCIMYEYYNRIKIPFRKTQFNGKIHFITMLRNPIERYISEFYHVKRGATWEKAVRACTEQPLYTKTCYGNNKNWTYVEWSDFLTCEYNLANNRMTRMLANYNQLGCRILKCWINDSSCSFQERYLNERKIIESAKQTLLSISFFGLTEYQSLSQYLFERTFKNKMKFSEPLRDSINKKYETSNEYKSLKLIKQRNHLDLELYAFGKELFFKRIKFFQDNNI